VPIRMSSATGHCIAFAMTACGGDGFAQAKEENGMARIAGGTYTIGSRSGPPDSRPATPSPSSRS
jgi:hypothetical protein